VTGVRSATSEAVGRRRAAERSEAEEQRAEHLCSVQFSSVQCSAFRKKTDSFRGLLNFKF
jgi:hypothetical protein